MPPKKMSPAPAAQQPTRRSTRARKPTDRALDGAYDDATGHQAKETLVAPTTIAADADEAVLVGETGIEKMEEDEQEENELVAATVAGATEEEDQAAVQDHGGQESSAEGSIVVQLGEAKAGPQLSSPLESTAKVPDDAAAATTTTTAVKEEDELAAERPAIKIIKVMEGTRKSRSKYDKAEEMLTNPRSPLVDAKLRDILCSPKAWDLLDEEEKQRVLAKFPTNNDEATTTAAAAGPDIASLRSNDDFRHDVARYQDDLREGKHDPEWIQQAQVAHQHRVIGFYDKYLATRFEEDWGMEMP